MAVSRLAPAVRHLNRRDDRRAPRQRPRRRREKGGVRASPSENGGARFSSVGTPRVGRVPGVGRCAAAGPSPYADDDDDADADAGDRTHDFGLRFVFREPGAHARAILAIAAVDDEDEGDDSVERHRPQLPSIITSSMDKTVSHWRWGSGRTARSSPVDDARRSARSKPSQTDFKQPVRLSNHPFQGLNQ